PRSRSKTRRYCCFQGTPLASSANSLSEPDSQPGTTSIHECASSIVRIALPKLMSIVRSPLANKSVCMEIDSDVRCAECDQEVTSVEGFARGDDTCCLDCTGHRALCCFHNDWGADRVDVASSCHGASLLSASPYHHVHDKDLRRAPACIRWRRRRRVRFAKVCKWSKIHERANLRRSKMARDRDGLRHRHRHDLLFTERCRKH